MAIVLDAKQIIDGGIVENERIEYKEGWNPESILHTVCAFANDIENQSGGYIIIGVRAEHGKPTGVVGVDSGSVDRINADLINLCHQIVPRYLVESEYMDYNGKGVLVIKVPGGADRPYRCPVSLAERRSDTGSYIRKMGRTIRANASEEKELFRVSERIPFDDRPNYRASLSDLSLGLMLDYLRRTDSRMYSKALAKHSEAVAEDLHLIGGPPEDPHPLNVGLMFFNDHPEDFFKYARIEIVYKPDPTGMSMEETVIDGPLDRQIRDAVATISNMYIREFVTKVEDRPEAVRAYNFPRVAVEEALSNAVYHKAYDIPEPITVYIYPDRMEITSIPGPDLSISDEDLRMGRLVSKRYRNRRIGEFLKDMDLVEGRNTGVPLMIDAMRVNGSDPPLFQTDGERSYMTVILPVNRHFLREAKSSKAEGTRRTRDEIMSDVLALLAENGEMSIRQLSDAMGYRNPPSSLRTAVEVLVSGGSVEYVYPDTPNTPKQRVRLSGHSS